MNCAIQTETEASHLYVKYTVSIITGLLTIAISV